MGYNVVTKTKTKIKDNDVRLRYAAATVEHGWSRNILAMKIEAGDLDLQADHELLKSSGRAVRPGPPGNRP